MVVKRRISGVIIMKKSQSIVVICILMMCSLITVGNIGSADNKENHKPLTGTLNPIWNRTCNWGSANSVVDDNNNLYLVGSWPYKAVVLKYDKDGNFIWNRTWGNNVVDDCAYSIARASNNIYVVGYCDGDLSFPLESKGDGIKGFFSSPTIDIRISNV